MATPQEADLALAKRCVRDRVSVLRHLHHPAKGLQVGLEHMGFTTGPVSQDQLAEADAVRWTMIGQLSDCETFAGDEQVCALLNANGSSYPTAHMYLTDILAPTGMVYFT